MRNTPIGARVQEDRIFGGRGLDLNHRMTGRHFGVDDDVRDVDTEVCQALDEPTPVLADPTGMSHGGACERQRG